MSSAFGGNRGVAPKPPEKGVFPLDHFGECKEVMQEYLGCLKQHGGESQPCRELSKKYLECRMGRNLMAPQDLRELGFKEEAEKGSQTGAAPEAKEASPNETGYVAGLKRFKK